MGLSIKKDSFVKIWEDSLLNADKMPPCPKCGGIMKDDSSFTVCGAKCTNCDFCDYECGLA